MHRAAALVLLGGLFTACNPGALEAQPFEGIWQSDGWGLYLLIEGGEVEIFEHTQVHCLSVATAGARGITDAMSFDGERLLMRDADREIRFDQIEVLPLSCADAGPSDDPVVAATVLAETIEEQYIGDLDPAWPERRMSVIERAGEESLFELLVELIEPLGGRVRLAGDDVVWPPLPDLDAPDGVETGGAGGYAFVEIGDVAYLGLTRVGPFDADPEESQRIAGRVMDRVVRSAAVVLDLRASTGGTLRDALLMATRLVPTERVAAIIRARAGTGFVPAGELSISPLQTGVFDGPVFVLIGPETRGVGELLAEVLAELDTVTTIGAPTAGDPGPPLIRFLPNAWSVAVPNLEVLDADGTPIGSMEPDVPVDDALAESLRRAR